MPSSPIRVPTDRRAKLIYPTERGLLQMEAAASIMRAIEERLAEALGEQEYSAFKAARPGTHHPEHDGRGCRVWVIRGTATLLGATHPMSGNCGTFPK